MAGLPVQASVGRTPHLRVGSERDSTMMMYLFVVLDTVETLFASTLFSHIVSLWSTLL